MEKVNLVEKFSRFSDQWSPKVVGAVDDYEIKLVKVEGEFVWHDHPDEDEMFLVVEGDLTIKLRACDIRLGAGEFFVVPKGIEHKPVAEHECKVLLLERKDVVNTGAVVEERTVSEPERI